MRRSPAGLLLALLLVLTPGPVLAAGGDGGPVAKDAGTAATGIQAADTPDEPKGYDPDRVTADNASAVEEEPEDYSGYPPGMRRMLEDLRSGVLESEAFINHGYAKLGFLGGVPEQYRDTVALNPEEYGFLSMVVGRELEKLPHPVRQSIINRSTQANRLKKPVGLVSSQQTAEATATANTIDIMAATPVEGCGNKLSYFGRGDFTCYHEDPNFQIWFNKGGSYGVDPDDTSTNYAVGDVPGNGIPNYIDRTMRSLESALATYRTTLGYKQAQDQYKIQVFIGPDAMHDKPNSGGFAVPPTLTDAAEIWTGHKVDEFYTPRHELFHVMQYGYLQLAHVLNINVVNSWMESTAEWGAHQALRHDTAVPQDSRVKYAHDLGVYFSQPHRGLLAWDGFSKSIQYGQFVFAEYLDQRFGTDAVKHTWERLANDNPHDALWDTMTAYGAQPREEFRTYAVADYHMCPTVTPPDYGTSWHYTDPDVPEWCKFVTGGGQRPEHRIMNLPADGKAASGVQRLGGAGADYVDLLVSGDPSQIRQLQVKSKVVLNSVGLSSVTVISWKNIPGRCVADQHTDVPYGGAETALTTRIGGSCIMVTVMLQGGSWGYRPDFVQWESQYIGGSVAGAGLVEIGVQRGGNLIIPGENPSAGTKTTDLGLRLKSTNLEGVADIGCFCEGWGVQVTPPGGAGQWSGWSHGVQGLSPNAEVTEFSVTGSSVTSVVRLRGITSGDVIVTHTYRPSSRPELYDVEVRIEALDPPEDVPHITYRRIVDWDVEPTPLHEYVTVKADHPNVEFASDHGLGGPDPASGRPVLFNQGSFTDAGPYDQGTLFDFSVPLEDPPGPDTGNVGEFHLYYGAAPNQADALAALADVGAPVYSLAKPSTAGNPASGEPTTFVLGYKPVT
ncbi:DUF6055 domain-containing protein [Streptomyces sp. NPDC001978]|uniref:DUF6055 domain-containing protein n=1 Tax=Streptomyces sp. NPDC001978 TaxID=3364627 RepID=UPI00368EFBE8